MENLKPIEIIDKILDTLVGDESEVIKLFYGIKDGSEHSVEDIANILGKSVDEVKETYTHAFRKLMHPSRSAKLANTEFIAAVANDKGYKELTDALTKHKNL